ncbi:GtrA family protein [Alterisphingorhabdus coralli]|uniref:GtrA family protein n=1 Tax=Alterisphingorhabdus coralli TaxID=3071408 RepID=A0AA97F5W6_9SPHN|nr:GtrA family protein [Parasphingorhabdus sp. SCSIO 66989]WOE74031.1 GtrA family protein [Parasphingorhabdus sp. SCSIO 66989]
MSAVMPASMNAKSLLYQSTRFLIAGVVIFLFDYAVFWLSYAHLHETHLLAANIYGKVAGVILGFFLHKYWTFAGQQRHGSLAQSISYALLFLFTLVFSSALLYSLATFLMLPEAASRLFSDIASVAVSFAVSKWIIFRHADNPFG